MKEEEIKGNMKGADERNNETGLRGEMEREERRKEKEGRKES